MFDAMNPAYSKAHLAAPLICHDATPIGVYPLFAVSIVTSIYDPAATLCPENAYNCVVIGFTILPVAICHGTGLFN